MDINRVVIVNSGQLLYMLYKKVAISLYKMWNQILIFILKRLRIKYCENYFKLN